MRCRHLAPLKTEVATTRQQKKLVKKTGETKLVPKNPAKKKIIEQTQNRAGSTLRHPSSLRVK